MSDGKIFSLPEVESLAEVPDEYKAFYFEKEGKVHRQKPDAMASTMAKQSRELERQKEALSASEQAMAAYREALGENADPAKLKELKEKAALADSAHTPDEVKARLDKQAATFAEEKKRLQSLVSEKDQLLDQVGVMGEIKRLLATAGVNKMGEQFLPDQIRKRVDVRYENGTIKLIPQATDGGTLIGGDGQDASMMDLIQEFKSNTEVYGQMFNGTQNSGSGSGNNGGRGGFSASDGNWFKMSREQQIAYRKQPGMTQERVNAFIAHSMRENTAQ